MSTKMTDPAAQMTFLASVPPALYTGAADGDTIDLTAAGDGPGLAVLCVGDLSAGAAVAARLQHATDGVTWADLPGGAFPTVADANVSRLLTFDWSRRYVRVVLTLSGTSPEAYAVAAVGVQRKLR